MYNYGAAGGGRTLTDLEVLQLPKLVRLPIPARRHKVAVIPTATGSYTGGKVSGALTVDHPIRNAATSVFAKYM